ncbi:MAG: hypothetical protein Ct9H300mP6_11960 [Gammaproteobacteria bacterium]|nr:MAG: hypothetical protein Ct9H300mP6_11960 [Gammaproteobacteria bacterium]
MFGVNCRDLKSFEVVFARFNSISGSYLKTSPV